MDLGSTLNVGSPGENFPAGRRHRGHGTAGDPLPWAPCIAAGVRYLVDLALPGGMAGAH